MVASGSKNLLEQRMKVCTLLWDAGIKVGVFCRYTDTGYLMLMETLLYCSKTSYFALYSSFLLELHTSERCDMGQGVL